MSEHSYRLVVRGKREITTVQQPHTRNGIPANQSDDHAVRERLWSVPNPNKIDRDWGTECLLVASCDLTSDFVCALVKPICKRNLFFVILG